MNPRSKHGFTIIETMLFLAVTAVLATGVLAGSGVVVAQQRYKDAVMSLQDVLQQQYTQAGNVINDREATWKCNADATVHSAEGSALDPRGASECLILGRLVEFRNDGRTIAIANVIGSLKSNQPQATNDIEALEQYNLARSPVNEEVAPVAWGAQLLGVGGDAYNRVILILRSPFSGSIRTFISSTTPLPDQTLPANMLDSGLNDVETLCVSPEGFSMGAVLGVKIQSGAGGPSAIEQVAEGSGC